MAASSYSGKLLIVAALAFSACYAADPPADLALKNGAVYTVDGARSWAQAVAIREGRIIYVGTDQNLQAHVGPSTRMIDLKGRMLMPGFQDAHIHPIGAGLEANSLQSQWPENSRRIRRGDQEIRRCAARTIRGSPAAAG